MRRRQLKPPACPPKYVDGWGNRCGLWDFKQRVRYRDGYVCRHCGITQDQYRERRRFVRQRVFHVHRIVPGSPYTWEGVITLCPPCHKRADNEISGRSPPKP